VSFRIEKQVLWLDVAMADAARVNVCQTAEQLVHVQLRSNTHEQDTLTASPSRKIPLKWLVGFNEITISTSLCAASYAR